MYQVRVEEAIRYPHVYLSPAAAAAGSINFGGGQRMAMPAGTKREDKGVSSVPFNSNSN